MFCKIDLRIKKAIANPTCLGSGISERKIAAGRCVKTIVLMGPMRLAMDEAMRMEIAAQMLVAKNKLPSTPSGMANLRVKKYVIHVTGTRPEARASTAKRRQSLRSTTREAGEMVGQMDFWIDGNGFVL